MSTTDVSFVAGLYCGGPWISTAGAVYLLGVTDPATGAENVGMAKSLDPSTSGLALVDTEWPPGSGETIGSLWGHQVGDIIHVVAQTDTGRVTYRAFDCATDTWGSEETIKSSISDFTEAANPGAALTVRGDGDVVVIYNSVRTQGLNTFGRSKYARRVSGSWTVDVDVAGADNYSTEGIVLGADDRVHFFVGSSPSDLSHRSVSTAYTFDTLTVMASGSAARPVSYEDGSSIRIAVPVVEFVTGFLDEVAVVEFTSGADPTFAEPVTVLRDNPSLSGLNRHLLWLLRDETGIQWLLFAHSDETPDAPEELKFLVGEVGESFQDTGRTTLSINPGGTAAVFTRDNAITLGFHSAHLSGSTVYYCEEVVLSPAAEWAVNTILLA